MRWLVQSGQIDGVMCTWYDRLTRSRDFYTLDHEFRANDVKFITLHDAADTRTAAGRFMESMIVAAKTYDRDQTSGKVRTKMRMRLEKGLHQCGLVPFGFTMDAETKMLHPDPEQVKVIEQIFRVYIETSSDFAVRDWLKTHRVLSPRSAPLWQVSTLCDLLSNRRYIGEIEINRANKGLPDLQESDVYRVAKAPHEPLIPVDLFELAQSIRRQKSAESPNRVGRPRSYSQNQCARVYTLQGRMVCGICGHAMTPYYVVHKPGKGRVNTSFIHYYICCRQQNFGRHESGHSNRVLARLCEGWIVDRVSGLVCTKGVIEKSFEMARMKCLGDQQPQQESLNLARRALQENQAQIDKLIETITYGAVSGDLMVMLSEKATALKLERERLRIEHRQLELSLVPMDEYFDTLPLRKTLSNFSALAGEAEPVEMQQLLRCMVRRIEWQPSGEHVVEFYGAKKSGAKKTRGNSEELPLATPNNWLEVERRSDGPDRIRTGDLLRDRQTC